MKKIFESIYLGFTFSATLIMCILVISSNWTGGVVSLDFNYYNELHLETLFSAFWLIYTPYYVWEKLIK
jgi:hypothetical protein